MNNYEIEKREWWVQQWIDLLESYRFKKRLERARTYARQGNVLKIEFREQKVLAQVQGTEPEPYKVSLSLEPFTDEQWNYVLETLSEQAIYAAKLLAGEMPPNIEDVFTANGLSLFPFKLDEIRSKCSCPDKANPCKHVGAVYYLLGDRFSEDPFVLFQLRGRTKEQILSGVRQMRSKKYATQQQQEAQKETPNQIAESTGEPAVNIEQFWEYSQQLESSLVVIVPPPSSETVLDFLGFIPLTAEATGTMEINRAASEAVMTYLKNVYQQVSQQAVLSAMN